jgi:hypothetical protein
MQAVQEASPSTRSRSSADKGSKLEYFKSEQKTLLMRIAKIEELISPPKQEFQFANERILTKSLFST